MRILILILALMVSSPLLAANFTWEVTTAAGTVSQDSPTISDANMDRFLDYVWVVYPQYEADGVTLKPKTNGNLAASVRDWMSFQWQDTKRTVIQWEKSRDAQVAIDAVTDIE